MLRPPGRRGSARHMTFQAIFFDLDGTLLDTERLWVQAVQAFLNERGLACTPDEATALVYGRAWHDIYHDLAARHPDLALGAAKVNEMLRPRFLKLRHERDVRIPTSVGLLKRLAATHPVAIVSGSPREEVADSVALMGIGPLLRFFLGSEDYQPGKPDPACFLLAAQRLGAVPAHCLVFEDSAAGVRAAKAAGMTCVALARPAAPAQAVSPADLILDDLDRFRLDRLAPDALCTSPLGLRNRA